MPVKKHNVTLLLSGDVMTGRGIDQVLPHPSDPVLYEPYVRSATTYVDLAERANGVIGKPVDFAYPWGDLLSELERKSPDAVIVNLETAVTESSEPWPRKGINYRMAPANIQALAAAGIACCVLANNHLLDWGVDGLHETLKTLRRAGLATSGAGATSQEAKRPAILETHGAGRVLVFSFGTTSSGIPSAWRATATRPGVWLLDDLSEATVERVAAVVAGERRPGDILIASIHWGRNWGYEIPAPHRSFAHQLIDRAGIDVVHGHSSHHPLGIEVYRDRPILYGCGDFLNDYEGIAGHQEYRGELTLGYWLEIEQPTGQLVDLSMTPFRIRRFRLERAADEDSRWLALTLDREGRKLGTGVTLGDDGRLLLSWTS
jgi:poly-gamma-glutamate synthesis protein (capsule biosynthesis protein)